MESNSILIENTLILDGEKMEKGSILIENDKIRELSADIDKKDADKVIDGSKKILIPGLVNTHTHLSMTLLRGLADDLNLDTWLNDHIWPMEANLNGDYCYAGALLGCVEMIKSGTTTFNDMYFYMEDVARAVEESGLRCMLSHGMIDLGDADKQKEEFKKTHHLIEKCHNSASGKIKVAYGPHSPYTCSEELLKQVRKEATRKGIPIHIHVGETRNEVQQVTDAHGKRPFEYLDEIGFLKEDVLAAHGVWLSPEEINIIKKRKVNLSHNPASNMKLASGVSPVDQLLKNDMVVGLGTDGAASNNNLDMLEEMKLAALLQKVHTLDPTSLPAEKVFQMATVHGAIA
ncbi:MAG: amidohydrolase family protein, partial [Euryarchaeota archaeon]|nr:amidohydrolase family protein [Euryarchaeota archaeon]MBV1766712.1 amidohydrolase family protein [Methanobacterium sp.]